MLCYFILSEESDVSVDSDSGLVSADEDVLEEQLLDDKSDDDDDDDDEEDNDNKV